jgi:hypothetical protein
MTESTGPFHSRRWQRKATEGKMFHRMECDRCRVLFNFGDSPRVTRVPRCPACGSLASHPRAA